MKSYRKELWFEVPGRRGFVNITPQVEASLADILLGIRPPLVPPLAAPNGRQRPR